MDSLRVIDGLFSILLVMVGWWCNQVWSAMQSLKTDLSKLEVAIPQTYVRRDELREDMREIKETLTNIFNKLDGKADK